MAFEPEYQKKEIILQCPFKFCVPENGIDCVKDKCALWLPKQRACGFQVLARDNPKRRIEKW